MTNLMVKWITEIRTSAQIKKDAFSRGKNPVMMVIKSKHSS
jgi:hypothetical protein